MSRRNPFACDRRTASCCLLGALAAFLVAAGCASIPTYQTAADWPQRRAAIRTVGLLPPAIRMFEEQAAFGMNKTVPREEWSPPAAEAVTKALEAETAARGWTAVNVSVDERDVRELAALYNAVEFSIRRHAWDAPSGSFPPPELFPEKVNALDYSVGPLPEAMDRYHIDAVWLVRGYNLLPTPGANVKNAVEVAVGVLAAMGGAAMPVLQLKKLDLTVALVDRNGNVLYYGRADEEAWRHDAARAKEATSFDAAHAPALPEEIIYLPTDLREPRASAYFIKAALSGCRTEAAP